MPIDAKTAAGSVEPTHLSWFAVTGAAANEFVALWDGTAAGASAAVNAWNRAAQANIAGWEELAWPESFAPIPADLAVRDIGSQSNFYSLAGHTSVVVGGYATACERLELALRMALDPELLNDLAVMLHAAGRPYEAEAVLRTAVAFAPDYAEALENLEAVAGSGPA